MKYDDLEISGKLKAQYASTITKPIVLTMIAIVGLWCIIPKQNDKFMTFLILPFVMLIGGLWMLMMMIYFINRVSGSALIKELMLTPVDLDSMMWRIVSCGFLRTFIAMIFLLGFWYYEVFIEALLEKGLWADQQIMIYICFVIVMPGVILYLHIHSYAFLLKITNMRIYELVFRRKLFKDGDARKMIVDIVGCVLYPFWPFALGQLLLMMEKPSHANGAGAGMNAFGVLFVILFWIFITNVVFIAILSSQLRFIRKQLSVFGESKPTDGRLNEDLARSY